jgi:hypothetical protein
MWHVCVVAKKMVSNVKNKCKKKEKKIHADQDIRKFGNA